MGKRSPEGAKVPVSLRFTRSTLDAIEADAARRGWTRQQWFDQVAAAQLRRGEAAAQVPAPSFPARPDQPVSRLRRGDGATSSRPAGAMAGAMAAPPRGPAPGARREVTPIPKGGKR